MRSTVIGSKTGLQVRNEIDERVPEVVKGDALRLRQVLQNILGNAVKFTEFGTVVVVVKMVKETEERVEILTEVTDTGVGTSPDVMFFFLWYRSVLRVGIPLDAVNCLFTPLTQLDNSATKRYKGTGLGLSICKSLVELMGGTIGFRPNKPQVTRPPLSFIPLAWPHTPSTTFANY